MSILSLSLEHLLIRILGHLDWALICHCPFAQMFFFLLYGELLAFTLEPSGGFFLQSNFIFQQLFCDPFSFEIIQRYQFFLTVSCAQVFCWLTGSLSSGRLSSETWRLLGALWYPRMGDRQGQVLCDCTQALLVRGASGCTWVCQPAHCGTLRPTCHTALGTTSCQPVTWETAATGSSVLGWL